MRAEGKVFAMDYLIPVKAESSNHLKFIGEFGQGAILYAYITVVNKFGGLEEDWWFAHVAGDQKRGPEKESGREWKFFVSPDREKHFEIDLIEEADRVMDNGKYFSRIKKLRLRGGIILSPIKLVKD